ncbi:hypothetical protein Gotur_006478 [Gossypium turneri]
MVALELSRRSPLPKVI